MARLWQNQEKLIESFSSIAQALSKSCSYLMSGEKKKNLLFLRKAVKAET